MRRPGPAVVVGGASGIGAAVVARHRARGTEVLVWDVAGDCDVMCDISDPAQVSAAAKTTLDTLGPPATVDITAGIGHAGLLARADAAEWDQVLGVNAKGPWLVMRSLAAAMAEGGGSIVAVSSVSARLVDQGMGLYCASKAALEMVIRVAAAEWAPAIRVNAVAPGVTDTAMLGATPRDGAWLSGVAQRTVLGRLGTPDGVAQAIEGVHAMEWVTGAVLTCDGGLSLSSPITAR